MLIRALDPCNEHVVYCIGRTRTHYAAVVLRMCKQATTIAAYESVRYLLTPRLTPSRRPHLVHYGTSTTITNQPLFDFTSTSTLKVYAQRDSISWKEQGYAATKSIADKRARYANAYDATECNFAPIAMGSCH
mmetsp:Transcript_21643/g.27675  ORF Transcript_21643/g.27675 Transcript_21643/m.27675 type:complete len:133 (+) Transcript_21643:1747-2145(+)